MTRAVQGMLLAVLMAAFPLSAIAQAYPARPIRVLVPFPPGGTPDIQIRMLAEKLTPRLGQQIVIDNRGGASGNVGMDIVARAPADGYTLLIGTVGNWTVNPHLHKQPFNVLTDFAPIIHIASGPAVLVVHPALPVTNVKELIALAARKPGELNYGGSGVGGFGHICAELFSSMTRIKLTHVPYKGVAFAMTELIGGQIQLMFNSAVPTLPHIKAGRVRALATTGATRFAAMAELPTIAEAGVPGYENLTWSLIAAPSRTSPAIVERLNREIDTVLQIPDIKERFAAAGSTVTGGSAKLAQDILKSELAKYGKLVVDAGILPVTGL